jgi:hypothetical protein
MQKVLQKIEHVCESVLLDDQGHSPRPRGEELLWLLYACDGPSSASSEEREEETYKQKSYKVNVERLHSAGLIHGDQNITTRHAMALSKAEGTHKPTSSFHILLSKTYPR